MSQNLLHPIDFPLPQDVSAANSAILVHLPTLDELDAFWSENAHRFSYAAQGLSTGSPTLFLRPNEWVFGTTKAAVVSAVCRWEQIGIRCEWYDWAVVDPLDHAGFFSALREDRNAQIAAGSWSEQEEKNYQSRTPDSYRGWWKLENLPHGLNEGDWFGWGYDPGVIDPDLPAETVAGLMQEKTFDVWRIETYEEIEYLTADEVDGVIAYWKRERSLGDDYYGSENEPA